MGPGIEALVLTLFVANLNGDNIERRKSGGRGKRGPQSSHTDKHLENYRAMLDLVNTSRRENPKFDDNYVEKRMAEQRTDNTGEGDPDGIISAEELEAFGLIAEHA